MSRLKTERLELVPMEERFLTERYLGWLSDPEVVRFSDQRFRQHTMQGLHDYLKSFQGSPHFFWAVLDENGRHVGTLTAYVDVHHDVADVGIMIGEREVWGKGYGLEAWKAVCDFLLNQRKIRKVTAGTSEVNVGMLRIMERAGMVEDGRRKRQAVIEGREVDIIHAALFRP